MEATYLSKLSVVMNLEEERKVRALELALCRYNWALVHIGIGGSLRVASPISRVVADLTSGGGWRGILFTGEDLSF